MPNSGFVVVAHVVRPQGRKGEMIAEILTDFPQRFVERSHVWLLPPSELAAAREVTIERQWLHKGRIVLKFTGVDSIADAEIFRGWDIAVSREERVALADDSVYIADLMGCHLVDEANGGVDLGPVQDVARGENGAADLLVLKAGREELLVPFAKAYLVEIDPQARILRMRLPAGLTDLNAPMTEEERTAQQRAAADEAGDDAL
jgi:16S rRNA processing protein RimM